MSTSLVMALASLGVLIYFIYIGVHRTHTQDLEYAIDQLVEVAARALSTGVNDPFTVITSIDWLAVALSRLSGITFPSPYRYDEEGSLRIIIERPVTFEGVVDAAFNQIRQYAEANAAVKIRLLEAIATIASHTDQEERRKALMRQVRMIERSSDEELQEKEDRRDVEERYRKVLENSHLERS